MKGFYKWYICAIENAKMVKKFQSKTKRLSVKQIMNCSQLDDLSKACKAPSIHRS